MAASRGLDVSSFSGLISIPTWKAVRRDGWEWVIVQAWGALSGGGSGPNPLCRAQLSTGRSGGLRTAIYIVIPPDDDLHTHELIRVAKEAAGDEYEAVEWVALDIEDEDRRLLHPTDPEGRLAGAVHHIPDKPVAIYTNASYWVPMMRGSTAFSYLPLWEGNWHGVPELDHNFHSFGGWSGRAALQYQGTTTIQGFAADLNVVDPELIMGDVDPCAAVREQRDRLERQLEDFQHQAEQAAGLAGSLEDTLYRMAGK
jgi:hypothetical protein